ncbi:MAG: hypothetical protein AB7N24_20685 [Dehalococcoidia bacterium]
MNSQEAAAIGPNSWRPSGRVDRRPRRVQINQFARYFPGTGCVRFENGAVIELTVAEEELFELLLKTPKITVPWPTIAYELARSEQTIRHLMRGLRDKFGTRAIRTHVGRGISVQPHFVGSRRFALSNHPARAIPFEAVS